MKRAAEWTHPEEERSAKHGSPTPDGASECLRQPGSSAEQLFEGPHPACQITGDPQSGHAVVHGVDAKRGQRPYMEDAYQISSGSCAEAGGSYTICSVFDGHGGAFVADHCASNLDQRFSSCLSSSSSSGVHAGAPEAVGQALQATLSSLHNELKGEREAQLCGTTATVCVLTPSHICIASCGDSRAVIAKGGQAHQPIEDHSLQRADERERILAAGGRLIWNNGLRVMGALGMSRALGDHLLQAHGVSAEPEVALLPRSGGEDFLLLATDGLWGAVSNEEAVEVAYRVLSLSRFTRTRAMAAIPCVLTALATRRGSTDNITVLCIDLAPAAPLVAVPAQQHMQPVPMAPGVSGAAAAAAAAGSPALGAHVPLCHPGVSRPCCPPVVLPPPCVDNAPAAAAGAEAATIAISGRRSASSPLPRGLMAAAASFVAPTTPSPPRRPNRTVTTGAAPVPAAAPAAYTGSGMLAGSSGSSSLRAVAAGSGAAGVNVLTGPFSSSSSSTCGVVAANTGAWPPTWSTSSSAWPPASPFAGVAGPRTSTGGDCAAAAWPAADSRDALASRRNSSSSSRQDGMVGGSWLSLARSVSCSAVPQGARGHQGLQQGAMGGEAAAAAAGVDGRCQTPGSAPTVLPAVPEQQQQVVPASDWPVTSYHRLAGVSAAAAMAMPSPAALASSRRSAAGWAAAAAHPGAAHGSTHVAPWSAAAPAAAHLVEGQRRVSSSSGALAGMQAPEAPFKAQHRSSNGGGGGSMAAPSVLASVGSGLYKAGSGTYGSTTTTSLAKVGSGGFAAPAAASGAGGFPLMSAGSSGNLVAHPMLRPSRSLGPTGLLATARSGSATGRTPEVLGVARHCSADVVLGGGVAPGGLNEAGRGRGVTSLPLEASQKQVAMQS